MKYLYNIVIGILIILIIIIIQKNGHKNIENLNTTSCPPATISGVSGVITGPCVNDGQCSNNFGLDNYNCVNGCCVSSTPTTTDTPTGTCPSDYPNAYISGKLCCSGEITPDNCSDNTCTCSGNVTSCPSTKCSNSPCVNNAPYTYSDLNNPGCCGKQIIGTEGTGKHCYTPTTTPAPKPTCYNTNCDSPCTSCSGWSCNCEGQICNSGNNTYTCESKSEGNWHTNCPDPPSSDLPNCWILKSPTTTTTTTTTSQPLANIGEDCSSISCASGSWCNSSDKKCYETCASANIPRESTYWCKSQATVGEECSNIPCSPSSWCNSFDKKCYETCVSASTPRKNTYWCNHDTSSSESSGSSGSCGSCEENGSGIDCPNCKALIGIPLAAITAAIKSGECLEDPEACAGKLVTSLANAAENALLKTYFLTHYIKPPLEGIDWGPSVSTCEKCKLTEIISEAIWTLLTADPEDFFTEMIKGTAITAICNAIHCNNCGGATAKCSEDSECCSGECLAGSCSIINFDKAGQAISSTVDATGQAISSTVNTVVKAVTTCSCGDWGDCSFIGTKGRDCWPPGCKTEVESC